MARCPATYTEHGEQHVCGHQIIEYLTAAGRLTMCARCDQAPRVRIPPPPHWTSKA